MCWGWHVLPGAIRDNSTAPPPKGHNRLRTTQGEWLEVNVLFSRIKVSPAQGRTTAATASSRHRTGTLWA
eukprot:3868431-Amphidinium_carterae.2